jgi:hypothetical protein
MVHGKETGLVVPGVQGQNVRGFTLEKGGMMSDGREEREEREKRREQEERENREDRLNREAVDPWIPEREDS